MSRVARLVRVSGRVQGVFFRAWTRDEALRLGVGGWARNCADGTVEVRLEGEYDQVLQLLRMMHEGPAAARVDHIEASEVEPGDLNRFEIRH